MDDEVFLDKSSILGTLSSQRNSVDSGRSGDTERHSKRSSGRLQKSLSIGPL